MDRKPFKRRRMKFSWSEVPDEVVRRLVAARFEEFGDKDEVRKVRVASVASIRRQLGAAFLSADRDMAPSDVELDGLVFDYLVGPWLSSLGREPLRRVIEALPRNVRRPSRSSTVGELRAYLRRRRDRPQLRRALKGEFRKKYQVETFVNVGPPTPKVHDGVRLLQGLGRAQRDPWHECQIVARSKLDELFDRGTPFAARLILPTSAGKTATAAGWLLERMEADAKLRVLWLVHLKELAEQAVGSFVDRAEERSPGFTRSARVIHSKASARTLLADPGTDLAALTYQQLVGLDVQERDLLERFMADDRSTIVVVDEAHRAVSEGYAHLLAYLQDAPGFRGMIGLTATPPSGAESRQRFADEMFPSLVHRASLVELIAQRILAQPAVTTVDTNVDIGPLSTGERRAAMTDDFPATVLRRLNSVNRNRLVVKTWKEREGRWGPTLVFAANIEHAEALTRLLVAAGADARCIHSKMTNPRENLQWFRAQRDDAVLVSVGMLNEGVDLPKAQTAFIARATTSPVVMAQMIGRVLRGPKANGTATADIVHFRDRWTDLPDVLSPEDLLPIQRDPVRNPSGDGVDPFLDDDELAELADIASKLQHQFEQAHQMMWGERAAEVALRPPVLRDSRLVGYYEVDEYRIPVLDHQLDGFEALMSDAASNRATGEKRRPLMGYFDDAIPPLPLERSLALIRAEVEREREPLQLTALDVVVSPRRIAELIGAQNLSGAEELNAIRSEFERRFVQLAFGDLDAFADAVQGELRDLRFGRQRSRPEDAVPPPRTAGLNKLRRAPRRQLEPLYHRVTAQLAELVPEYADGLDPKLRIGWTDRVIRSAFAYWKPAREGSRARPEEIRVNRLLQAPRDDVPDDAICFLIYHELLHHLLPGNGHDTLFRQLEARWPNYVDHNLTLDHLADRFDLSPSLYR